MLDYERVHMELKDPSENGSAKSLARGVVSTCSGLDMGNESFGATDWCKGLLVSSYQSVLCSVVPMCNFFYCQLISKSWRKRTIIDYTGATLPAGSWSFMLPVPSGKHTKNYGKKQL